MFAIVILFLLVAIYCYPLTFMLRLESGRWQLFWLPRLFAAYGKPRKILLHQAEKEVKAEVRRLPRRFVLRLGKGLLKALRVEKLDFLFFPGFGHFQCIFRLSCGDIIRISVATSLTWWKKQRRKQRHGRRA